MGSGALVPARDEQAVVGQVVAVVDGGAVLAVDACADIEDGLILVAVSAGVEVFALDRDRRAERANLQELVEPCADLRPNFLTGSK